MRRSRLSTAFRRVDWQLPASIAALLVVVALAFGWLAIREVRQTALEEAGQRLSAVSRQIATLYAQSLQVRLKEVRTAAADPHMLTALRSSALDAGSRTAAEEALHGLLASHELVAGVELWSAEGIRILSLSRGDSPSDTTSAGGEFPEWALADTAPVVGTLSSRDGRATIRVAAPVQEGGRTLGLVVAHRWLSAAPYASRAFADLIGEQAGLRLGTPGGLWSDLYALVPPGPIESVLPGPAEYRAEGLTAWVGAGGTVPGTRLMVWVEFPSTLVFARAEALRRRLVPLGLLVVAVGVFVGWLLSRRVTRPLRAVETAALAMARGDVSQEVTVAGPLELRRLGDSFNVMARQIQASKHVLEEQVQARTAELRAANQELEAFSYSVSHDLRAPLRSIHGFSQALLEDYGPQLDPPAQDYLRRVCGAADRMGTLIDDLLMLSRVTRTELRHEPVDLSAIASGVLAELGHEAPTRHVTTVVAEGLQASGDPQLLRLVLRNLLENAWKFSSKRPQATIEVGRLNGQTDAVFVRDDGAGFDMTYADKLFGVFQRLHPPSEFPGTGVGLAIVQRVIHRHGGRVWAEAAPGRGATFFFTLPTPAEASEGASR